MRMATAPVLDELRVGHAIAHADRRAVAGGACIHAPGKPACPVRDAGANFPSDAVGCVRELARGRLVDVPGQPLGARRQLSDAFDFDVEPGHYGIVFFVGVPTNDHSSDTSDPSPASPLSGAYGCGITVPVHAGLVALIA